MGCQIPFHYSYSKLSSMLYDNNSNNNNTLIESVLLRSFDLFVANATVVRRRLIINRLYKSLSVNLLTPTSEFAKQTTNPQVLQPYSLIRAHRLY